MYFYASIYPMIWHIIRYWLTFLIPVFYKNIGIRNVGRLTVKGPVIIAMNHPNAFTDPIVISYVTFPIRLKYLARGDAFKPGIISTILEIIGIVPIFRIQDGGKEGLKKNDEAYRRVNYLLKRNAKLIVFAEGLCVQERRLRPLKKGVARMTFGAYEAIQNEDLIVVPVGVNYDMPHKFRSNVFYNVGEPILVKDYIKDYQNNPAKTNIQFLQTLEQRMKELITSVNDPQNDDTVLLVEALCKKDWIIKENLNPNNMEDDFKITQKITNIINTTAQLNQEKLNEFKTIATQYFDLLRKQKIRDWLINPNQNKGVHMVNFCFRILVLLILSPIFLLTLIGNFLPFYFTHKITKKSIKKNEFYSSVAIAIGMVLFLINYIIIYSIAHLINDNAMYSFAVCAVFMLAGWFGLFYHPYLFKTVGMARILKNQALFNDLKKQRQNLITLINNF